MKETLEVINQMQSDGVIGAYAIGGAVGATFYLEPMATLDLDVFVSFRQTSGTERLDALLERFGLLEKWERFRVLHIEKPL